MAQLLKDNLRRQGYYSQMQGVIEQMYEQNNRTKVTVVAHSMGGPVSLYFLNNITDQAWKDQYVKAYIPLSGAWDGAARMIATLLTGSAYSWMTFLPQWLRKDLRDLFRTFEGSYWMLPSEPSLGSLVIARVGDVNYTTSQYAALFQRANMTEGYNKYIDVKKVIPGWPAPNVPTYCFYGLFPGQNNTPETFVYTDEGFPLREPTIGYGLGDTTVNAKISEICLRWRNQSANFTTRAFEVSHTDMIRNASVLAAIGHVVGAPVNSTSSPHGGKRSAKLPPRSGDTLELHLQCPACSGVLLVKKNPVLCHRLEVISLLCESHRVTTTCTLF